jgi:hypothetical protein
MGLRSYEGLYHGVEVSGIRRRNRKTEYCIRYRHWSTDDDLTCFSSGPAFLSSPCMMS